MNIYICDDCLGDIARLKRYLDRYAAEKGFLFTIREFTSAFEMLKVWSVVPDIIFLDIYMQDIDGMQAANLIKKQTGSSRIIFITSSSDHAVEAFQIHADGYIKKPYIYADFVNAMSRVESDFEKLEKYISITVSKTEHRLHLKNILYLETGRHVTLVHTNQKIYKVSTVLSEISQKLIEERAFVRCGKSFVVNLNYISYIKDSDICMLNGDKIPIPRRIKKELTNTSMEYQVGKDV